MYIVVAGCRDQEYHTVHSESISFQTADRQQADSRQTAGRQQAGSRQQQDGVGASLPADSLACCLLPGLMAHAVRPRVGHHRGRTNSGNNRWSAGLVGGRLGWWGFRLTGQFVAALLGPQHRGDNRHGEPGVELRLLGLHGGQPRHQFRLQGEDPERRSQTPLPLLHHRLHWGHHGHPALHLQVTMN